MGVFHNIVIQCCWPCSIAFAVWVWTMLQSFSVIIDVQSPLSPLMKPWPKASSNVLSQESKGSCSNHAADATSNTGDWLDRDNQVLFNCFWSRLRHLERGFAQKWCLRPPTKWSHVDLIHPMAAYRPPKVGDHKTIEPKRPGRCPWMPPLLHNTPNVLLTETPLAILGYHHSSSWILASLKPPLTADSSWRLDVLGLRETGPAPPLSQPQRLSMPAPSLPGSAAVRTPRKAGRRSTRLPPPDRRFHDVTSRAKRDWKTIYWWFGRSWLLGR